MNSRLLGPVILCSLALSASASGQQLRTLPAGSWATDITPDGEIVVGAYNIEDGFIWRWRVDPSPTIIPGGTIEAVSDDGTVVAGNIYDLVLHAEIAAIWTEATGWQSLGWLPGAMSCPSRSSAYDISGDGTTVVGLSWIGCDSRGFRWTAATGMQELQALVNGNNRCSAISDDGSTLGGFAQAFDRTPAYWAPDQSGVAPDPSKLGEVSGFNSDGSLSVGQIGFGFAFYSAFVRDKQTGVMTNVGSLHTNWHSTAEDISEDGRTVVGFDYISLSRQAWVYKSTDGMISLNDRLTALGVTGAPPLLVCRAVSDDGNVVVGGAQGVGPFNNLAFIVDLGQPKSPWTNLGNGLAGTNGIPSLAGSGPLTAGSPTSVVLTQGKPGAGAAFVVGLSAIYAPFKQGVLVPMLDQLVLLPALSGAGSVALNFAWPGTLPSAFSLYWQVLVSDPVAPAGFALSNALKSTTP